MEQDTPSMLDKEISHQMDREIIIQVSIHRPAWD